MRILLTNDDGVKAEGLLSLFHSLSNSNEVMIVAPDRERSAASHSLSLRKPLRAKKIGERITMVNGTPTDCVILAINTLLEEKPDLIISGINHGPNIGDDVTYSGTVGAALEGAIMDIPSIAISVSDEKEPDFDACSRVILLLIELFKVEVIPKGVFLNINVPKDPKGIRITRLGKKLYNNIIEKRDNRVYEIDGYPVHIVEEGTDVEMIERGYISITPLKPDMTDYKTIEKIKEWEKFFDKRF
jgi:5'-nucleotidase